MAIIRFRKTWFVCKLVHSPIVKELGNFLVGTLANGE